MLYLELGGRLKAYPTPMAVTADGLCAFMRISHELEKDLLAMSKAHSNMGGRFDDSFVHLQENSSALFFSSSIPEDLDRLLLQLQSMQKGGCSVQFKQTYR